MIQWRVEVVWWAWLEMSVSMVVAGDAQAQRIASWGKWWYVCRDRNAGLLIWWSHSYIFICSANYTSLTIPPSAVFTLHYMHACINEWEKKKSAPSIHLYIYIYMNAHVCIHAHTSFIQCLWRKGEKRKKLILLANLFTQLPF